MDAKRFGLLAFAVVAVVGLVACQESEPAPVAPENDFEALVGEINSTASGGIKVDSDCGGSNSCGDVDREDNTLSPSAGADDAGIVWLVDGSGTLSSSCTFEIYDKGNNLVSSGSLVNGTNCDQKLRRFEFDVPGTQSGSGSVTMTVYCSGTKVGSDSFRVTTDNPSCQK